MSIPAKISWYQPLRESQYICVEVNILHRTCWRIGDIQNMFDRGVMILQKTMSIKHNSFWILISSANSSTILRKSDSAEIDMSNNTGTIL